MKRSITDNQCNACGTTRKKKLLVFTENYIPYCSSYWICSSEHPNHPKQKSGTKLYTYDEIQDLMNQQNPEESEFIRQLITKPFSLRISDYKTIKYLIDMQKVQDLKTFSDAIRYCIDYTINATTVTPFEQNEQKKVEAKVVREEFTF